MKDDEKPDGVDGSDSSECYPACSALREGGFRCEHGHSVTMGCRTNPLGEKEPGSYSNIPLCLRDDYEFDDSTKTVTRSKWAG